ncbi:M12 family metallo-peptidase [Streptomyces meridianus]|uniref:M12 family metallo-peptidase n=1 Tax=Streptomyces meridianus TaxID=2938945 RepID=A0ABT0X3M4_9ACTN|nr:M12 family metallo-peptidase [Streptomyces meridianus]MCM2577147.1 M12 family metallo-peptidase [Streptomyces meridianus]
MRRSLLAAGTAATALATLSLGLAMPAAATGSHGGKGEPWVVREGVMRADAKDYRSLCKEKDGKAAVRTFPLFDGKKIKVVQDVLRRDENGTVYWSGHDPKHPGTSIAASVLGACGRGPVTLSGVAQMGFRQYQYDPLSKRPGWYSLQEIDSLKLPPNGQGIDTLTEKKKHPKPPKPPKDSKRALQVATPENPAGIDIVVAYTPATVTELGSVAAVQSRIEYGVNQLNRAFASSNVPASVHVVNTYQTEPTGIPRESAGSLLDMIKDPANQTLGAEAATARQTYSADLVALLASIPAEDSSGKADLPTPATATTDSQAFSVTSIYSVTGWENLAHEIGHNFGLWHDRQTVVNNGGTPPPNTIHYGWITPNLQNHTIMAYDTPCRPQNCKVVNQYSNTENTFDGQPLGDEDNNNAAVARESTEIVAGYRASQVTNRTSLTYSADPAGGGTVRPSLFGPYDPNTQVTLTATSSEGFQFDGWTVDGVLQEGTTPQYQITMDTNHTVVARFSATG